MSLLTTGLAASVMTGVVGYLAARDHRKAVAARSHLLDDCVRLFDQPALSCDGDGFPRLAGRCGESNVDVRLVCDTMTMRRLPQLWLQVTVLERLDGVSGLAALIRPTGYDFYSLTSSLHHVIEPTAALPSEVIVRGKDARAAGLFRNLVDPMAKILADPRVKEIDVTKEGLRITRQMAEGRRGEHLLLRQAVFDDAAVPAVALLAVLDQIAALRRAIPVPEAHVA